VKRQNSITQIDFSNLLQTGALLRYGSDWILGFGGYNLVPASKTGEISVFCPLFYDIEEGKAIQFQYEARLTRTEFINLCRQYLEIHPEKGSFWDHVEWKDPDMADFSKAFSHTLQLIGQGQIDKAVPYVAAKAPGTLPATALVKALLELADAPPSLHVYGMWLNGEGFVGATPEILFEKKEKSLATMALAGTLAKTSTGRGELLLKDKKELQENQLVVDDIKQQLRALGLVKTHVPAVMDLPTLWHLVTHIEVALEEDVPVIDLVKRLHPTPALGVAPRRFGWRWMREWPQQSSRGHFGAPFLMKVDDEHWMCLVAIRNIEWTKSEMFIGSGCGVVKDSDLEREWLELFYKRQSVKKILGIPT
jgi:isochorismate synthase EntC